VVGGSNPLTPTIENGCKWGSLMLPLLVIGLVDLLIRESYNVSLNEASGLRLLARVLYTQGIL